MKYFQSLVLQPNKKDMNRKEVFIFLLVLLLGSYKVFSQDEAGGEDDPVEARKKECTYLNSVRTNFTFCCDYPVLVIWTWQYRLCEKDCKEAGRENERCCILPCCFKWIKVITAVNKEGEKSVSDVDWRGLVYSFLLSVGNDTQWEPVLNLVCDRCYQQFSGNPREEEYDCEEIPRSLYTVIDCSYNQNYIMCPTFNPHNVKECDFTMQFVKRCLVKE